MRKQIENLATKISTEINPESKALFNELCEKCEMDYTLVWNEMSEESKTEFNRIFKEITEQDFAWYENNEYTDVWLQMFSLVEF